MEDKIRNRLLELGYDFDGLKPSIKRLLIRMEHIIEERFEAQNEAILVLKSHKLSIVSVTRELGIARATIYNNPILKEYFEIANKEIEKDNPDAIIKSLKEANSELEEVNIKMIYRDLDVEFIKRENTNLMKLVNEKEESLNNVRERNIKLSKEVEKLKSKNQKSKVMKFPTISPKE